MKRIKKKLSVWQLLALGYVGIILIGGLLLFLPFSTRSGESTSFLNAIFTSTSATCVTGLVAYDTNTHWSIFGQIVILLLIQIGGLGFMTLVSVLFNVIGHDMGLQERKTLMVSSGVNRFNNLRPILKKTFLGTVIFETTGAILLSVQFIQDFGVAKGIWYAIFHSISAFCNAGFDLMGGTLGEGKFVSLSHYATNPLVSLTICALIIIGGLGFCVWNDLVQSKGKIKKLCLHTKVAVFCTCLLLVLSTVLFFVFERNNAAFENYSTGEKLLISFFNAVTPRTAGFNTVDFATLSDSSYLLMVVLMFIGGSSGSTAGGIKVTTLVVIVMGIITVFRNKRDIDLGKKRIDNSLSNQALAIFASCLSAVVISTIIICAIEPNDVAPFKSVLFETMSAMGTVGLSLSLTPVLSYASKIILMLLMFIGRVGIVTLALALSATKKVSDSKKPLDSVLIG